MYTSKIFKCIVRVALGAKIWEELAKELKK